MTAEHACDGCLARAWLLSRLAGHLEPVRARLAELLGLGDDELIEAVGGEHRDTLRREFGRFDARDARARVVAAGLQAICCCHRRYPDRLYELEGPPAVLHVAGELERFLELVREDPVAIVGARRASGYGTDVARSLGRGLGASGVTVVSGMALGVDAASHAGALDGRGWDRGGAARGRRAPVSADQARAPSPHPGNRGGHLRTAAG